MSTPICGLCKYLTRYAYRQPVPDGLYCDHPLALEFQQARGLRADTRRICSVGPTGPAPVITKPPEWCPLRYRTTKEKEEPSDGTVNL